MIPKSITLEEINSDSFIQEFRRSDRHIVCIAEPNHPIVEMYTGVNIHSQETRDLAVRINEVMQWANADGFVTNFFTDHNYALTVLPQLVYSCELAPGYPNHRNDYAKRPFISRCIKAVFDLNRGVIRAPKITFLFENRNFNVAEGIELMYHHATSNLGRKDRVLTEITFWDGSIEPDQHLEDGVWVLDE